MSALLIGVVVVIAILAAVGIDLVRHRRRSDGRRVHGRHAMRSRLR